MSAIGNALKSLRAELPKEVTLVAVSKYHPIEDLMEAYNEGQRDFGENIVQELRNKREKNARRCTVAFYWALANKQS